MCHDYVFYKMVLSDTSKYVVQIFVLFICNFLQVAAHVQTFFLELKTITTTFLRISISSTYDYSANTGCLVMINVVKAQFQFVRTLSESLTYVELKYNIKTATMFRLFQERKVSIRINNYLAVRKIHQRSLTNTPKNKQRETNWCT